MILRTKSRNKKKFLDKSNTDKFGADIAFAAQILANGVLIQIVELTDSPIIIIGAGVGGLSTGILLVNDGFQIKVFEKSSKIGGRTASIEFKNHILDNGFHIMPFYKKSSIYDVLKTVAIVSKLKLVIFR